LNILKYLLLDQWLIIIFVFVLACKIKKIHFLFNRIRVLLEFFLKKVLLLRVNFLNGNFCFIFVIRFKVLLIYYVVELPWVVVRSKFFRCLETNHREGLVFELVMLEKNLLEVFLEVARLNFCGEFFANVDDHFLNIFCSNSLPENQKYRVHHIRLICIGKIVLQYLLH